ncbi:bactofilin family protein [Azospirillum canadense]|uniref:bactofilin family protein n=1 Tax=Azospirillum canadense TaxID=403962 RepID=UPI002225EB48|nr:polymer-forming cytoskeletal protein [Azospirillum canadense]MCW2235576.1 cytoskeletal protein CcmA (bactofilin family) [Azospirillum canadense]
MLFGRKTPPKAQGAAQSPDGAVPAAEANAAEPAVAMSPLSSLANASAALAAQGVQGQAVQAPAGHPAAPTSRTPTSEPFSSKGPEMNTTSPKPPTGGPIPGASYKPTDIPRRTVDLPGVAPRKPEGFGALSNSAASPAAPAAAPAPAVSPVGAPLASEQRRLIVGRDISLNGEIGSCDVLVVEGTVEAKLRDGRSIEIAETGLFKGSVEIDEADIGGRFEGDITVRGRLVVRSTGRINGAVKYGQLSVEAGGLLNGSIGQYKADAQPAAEAAPAPAAVSAATPAKDPIVVDG